MLQMVAVDALKTEVEKVSCHMFQTLCNYLTSLQLCKASPFPHYQPYRFCSSVVATDAIEGIHDVPNSSSLFTFCSAMCETGGSWVHGVINPLARYRLCAVQAVTHSAGRYFGYEDEFHRTSSNRLTGLQFFNFSIRQLEKPQLHVLDSLRCQFHQRAPGTDPRCANTFYSFHGCRREHVENICRNGIVATRATDAGFFGSGCYSTLNIEYAVRYSRGDFDHPSTPRASPDGRYPVIMFACFVSMAYPVTPLDYGNERGIRPGFSDYFGRPLKTGFDCHVICVNQANNFQAVERSECQYVEVVIDQKIQMLPVAVLWFERN
jgi:hypothetical protein